MAEFPTFKGSWPWPWPWIGSYCIGKKERKSIYIAPFIYCVYLKALRHGSHSFTCKYTMPAFFRTRSPDGATSNWGKRHPIAAYYSSIDPEGMKGWVGLAYLHASLINLYIHTKFHWNRKKLFCGATYCQLQSHVTQKLGQKWKLRPR